MQVNTIKTKENEVIMILSKAEALMIMKLIEVEYNYYNIKDNEINRREAISEGTKKEIEIRQNMWDVIHEEVY